MKLTSTLTLWSKKYFSNEFSRFLIVGGVNTILGYVVYAIFLQLFAYKTAYTAAFVLSVLFSYYFNSTLVFRVKMSFSALMRFPTVYLVQYIFGIVLMIIMVGKFGISEYLAPLFVILVTVPVTFYLSRWLLKEKGEHVRFSQ